MSAEPKSEGERRRADEAVGWIGLQHVASIAVAGRQHVAMEMHGAFGLAGRAGSEGNQADVFRSGVAGSECLIAGLAPSSLSSSPVSTPLQ